MTKHQITVFRTVVEFRTVEVDLEGSPEFAAHNSDWSRKTFPEDRRLAWAASDFFNGSGAHHIRDRDGWSFGHESDRWIHDVKPVVETGLRLIEGNAA